MFNNNTFYSKRFRGKIEPASAIEPSVFDESLKDEEAFLVSTALRAFSRDKK